MDPSRRTLSHSLVRHVLITGGTHGNEANSVYLAKHFLQSPHVVERPSFSTRVVLANPAAIAANVRYVDVDMNRCFLLRDLADDSLLLSGSGLEHARAKALDDEFGPKSSSNPKTDLCIDLHNTTADTGVALMMAHDDAFSHELAAHLMSLPIGAGVRAVEWAAADDYAVLPSLGRSGITFEVGGCPAGCLDGKWYAKSRELVLAALDFVHGHNAVARQPAAGGPVSSVPMGVRSLPVFRRVFNVDYPRDEEGDIAGMVHPDLQNEDFEDLREGQPVFLMLDGSARTFRAADHGWDAAERGGMPSAFFINEAAYYEKGVAFCLAKRIEVQFYVLAAKNL